MQIEKKIKKKSYGLRYEEVRLDDCNSPSDLIIY